jgi:glucosamine kinase
VTSTSTPAAIGLDIGGTSTRAVVLDTAGRRLGYGKAGGGNISSHDRVTAFTQIFAAIDAALAEVEPSRIVYGLIAAAGVGNFARPENAAELSRRWTATGMTCPYELDADAVAAFCAGTDRPDGTLVLSGTGALAAGLVDRALSTTVDAHGWLLGDRGSAFWLGREAVVHTLHALDVGRTPSPLSEAVLAHYGISRPEDPKPREVQGLLDVAVYHEPPIRLATLAPLVTSLAGKDDAADRIIAAAADHLVSAAAEVRRAGDDSPVVLAGSLLITETPVAAAVRDRIGSTWPAAPLGAAHDGAAGAAWLALIRGGLVTEAEATRAHATAFRA